nr:copia protein [Tanacetum cinerariifolium]
MIRTESGRMIIKNIDDMTIAEYMEYEAEMRRDPSKYTRNSGLTTLGGIMSLENMHQPDKLKTNYYFPLIPTCFELVQPRTDDIHEPLGNKPNDYYLFTLQSHYEIEEVSSDEDVDEWLNDELSKRMTGEDKEEEEGALIDILKIVVEECNMMPKSLFEHLKLANCKKTNMAIEMGNVTNKAPLRIVKNIPVKFCKFLFHSDFVVIDTLETILLGRPFLATIRAQIDVFRGEILLGVGNEKVKFDMNGEICHSRVPLEKIYVVSSIQESEYVNPHEIKNDDSLALGQRTFHYSKVSVNTVDSSSDSQENEVGSHLAEIVSRWHVCKPVHITFKVCEEDCGIWPTCNPDLSFCSGYDAIYGKEEIGMLKQWISGRKRYALEEVWEKCENFHDSTKQWYDEGFEEEELWQNGIEKELTDLDLLEKPGSRLETDTIKTGQNLSKTKHNTESVEKSTIRSQQKVKPDKVEAKKSRKIKKRDQICHCFEVLIVRGIFVREKMSRDVLTVGSTMRIPLLYRGEYSQWVERFMNCLEEQTDGEVMINSIKNGDQPLPRVTQVSIAGTSSNEQPPLKDKSMWSDQEKKIQKIDRLARFLLIQGLSNDIYSLIDSNKTAKDL